MSLETQACMYTEVLDHNREESNKTWNCRSIEIQKRRKKKTNIKHRYINKRTQTLDYSVMIFAAKTAPSWSSD